MLALLDGAVEWLVARGGPGQWGVVPFSASETMVSYLASRIVAGELRIAVDSSGGVIGGYVLGSRPLYVPSIADPERYIEAMVSDRQLAGSGIGARLVVDAVDRARRRGATILRADCWAGASRLIRWYEEQGFQRGDSVMVGDWPAQLLTMAI